MRMTISLDEQLAKQVRREAAIHGVSMSAFISTTLSDALMRRQLPEPPPIQLVTVRGVHPRLGIALDRPRALNARDDETRFQPGH